MLVEKSAVTQKLNGLLVYSKSQDAKNAGAIEALFSPVLVAVNSYFDSANPALSSALNDVVQYMYFDINRRTTKYENEFDDNLPTNYPTGYADVTLCFHQFDGLLNVSNAAFFSAFVYEIQDTSGDGGGTTEPVPVSNAYLTQWTADITAAATGDAAKISALAEWCKNSEGNCDLIDLLEDRGKVLTQKSREEIAADIYIDRGVLEIINVRGVDVYVPTYLVEGGDTDV